jgi:RNA polymerase sigma-70 factor (ECF subfamily)
MALSPSSAHADELYARSVAEFGPALVRLVSAYEADTSLRQDLLQEIHTALWRSFHTFDNRCALKTWVYRVAHNTAASHVRAARRHDWVGLEEVQALACGSDPNRQLVLERLMALIHQLRPVDRQIILLYLEGQDAASIAEIIGISAVNAGTKIHRVKNILTQRFQQGEHSSGTLRTPNRMAGSAMENESDHARELESLRTTV